MLAEELDADWSQVRMEQAPADPAFANGALARGYLLGDWSIPAALSGTADFAMRKVAEFLNAQITGGSLSVRATGVEGMRRTGAAARWMLVQAAAAAWAVPRGRDQDREGPADPSGDESRGVLRRVRDRGGEFDPPADVPLKPRDPTPSWVARCRASTPGEGRRQRALRRRYAPAGHGLRGGPRLPRVRRQGRELRRGQGRGPARRAEGARDPGRGRGRRRQHLARAAGARRAARHVRRGPGRGPLVRVDLRGHGSRASRRAGSRRTTRSATPKRRCAARRSRRPDLPAAVPRARMHGADELHGELRDGSSSSGAASRTGSARA